MHKCTHISTNIDITLNLRYIPMLKCLTFEHFKGIQGILFLKSMIFLAANFQTICQDERELTSHKCKCWRSKHSMVSDQ